MYVSVLPVEFLYFKILVFSKYSSYSNLLQCSLPSAVVGRYNYFEQIRVLKAGFKCLNICAWNNGIRPLFYFHWFLDQEVMINRSSVGGISITTREVKFLDRRKTNLSESICQKCFH